MNSFKKVFEFYIQSNLHVAIAVWCLSMITGLYFNIDAYSSALFLGLSTFVAYNTITFQKYRAAAIKKEVKTWFYSNRKLLFILNFLALYKLVTLVFYIHYISLIAIFPFILLTALYMLRIIKIKGQRYSLRSIPGLKIFSIAISWAGLVTFLPLIENSVVLGARTWIFFIQQFLFVLALALPFDIRDMDFDMSNLKTIPLVLGLKKTKYFAILILLSITVNSFFAFGSHLSVIFAITNTVLALFIWCSKKGQAKYYASFFIEAVPIFWFLLLYIYTMIA